MAQRSIGLRVMFLARSLDRGGAERQLVTLAKALRDRGHHVAVAVMYAGGFFQADLSAAGVPVFDLEKRGRWDMLGFILRLFSVVRRQRPQILHSYLVVPNVLSCLVKLAVPGVKIAWGFRASNSKPENYDWSASVVRRIETYLAWMPELVIVNSQAGMRVARLRGVRQEQISVIENGIDCDGFFPLAYGQQGLRQAWGIPDSVKLIGVVGRLDPMKGHATFLRAAANLAASRDDVRFVVVGEGPHRLACELKSLSKDLAVSELIVWAGIRADMCEVYNSLDILCSASEYGEGFSNAVGEAMACGTPCVVTAVGDSKRIVGELGIVVPPGDPDRLSQALQLALEDLASFDPEALRESIASQYSITRLATRTEQALYRLVNR